MSDVKYNADILHLTFDIFTEPGHSHALPRDDSAVCALRPDRVLLGVRVCVWPPRHTVNRSV